MSIVKKFGAMHWALRIVIAVIAVWLFMNLLLVTAKSATAEQLQSNLDTAVVVSENVVDPSILTTGPVLAAAIPAKCNRIIVWRKQSLRTRIGNITMAWRRTKIDRWCNNTRGVIYDWGTSSGDDGKWTGPGYCWYDETYGKTWNTVSRTEAKVWNQATLKVCGRLSLGHTVNPRIYFHAATTTRRYTYWNYGGTVIYH